MLWKEICFLQRSKNFAAFSPPPTPPPQVVPPPSLPILQFVPLTKKLILGFDWKNMKTSEKNRPRTNFIGCRGLETEALIECPEVEA